MIRMGYELASPMKTRTSISLLEQMIVKLNRKELKEIFGNNPEGFIRYMRYKRYLRKIRAV